MKKIYILISVAILFTIISIVNVAFLFNEFGWRKILLVASVLIIPKTLKDIATSIDNALLEKEKQIYKDMEE